MQNEFSCRVIYQQKLTYFKLTNIFEKFERSTWDMRYTILQIFNFRLQNVLKRKGFITFLRHVQQTTNCRQTLWPLYHNSAYCWLRRKPDWSLQVELREYRTSFGLWPNIRLTLLRHNVRLTTLWRTENRIRIHEVVILRDYSFFFHLSPPSSWRCWRYAAPLCPCSPRNPPQWCACPCGVPEG